MTITINLQFVAEADCGSALIRWFTQSDFSHVDAVLPSGELLGARSDTATPGVAIRRPGYATFSRVALVAVPATDTQTTAFYDFLRSQIGKPYDKTAIYAFAFNRDWHNKASWFCSELIVVALEWAGIIKPVTLGNRLTPNSAFLIASAVG
jgi:hypothetical protein